jgi:hypothetical protein
MTKSIALMPAMGLIPEAVDHLLGVADSFPTQLAIMGNDHGHPVHPCRHSARG